jgi:hypothetical protein
VRVISEGLVTVAVIRNIKNVVSIKEGDQSEGEHKVNDEKRQIKGQIAK